jgi:hypothetical protein
MQHDTSPYQVKLGTTTTVLIASMIYLRYSKRRYLRFYRRFNRFLMKCFLHEALRFWGYAAKICIIDNTSLARLRGTGANAVIVPEMADFAQEHGFCFICHEQGHANRKAGEERSFWTTETNFFPGRHFASLEELNFALSLCNIVQALLSPLLVFLLPGPGSILGKQVPPSPAPRTWQPALFISAALLCAGAIPVAAWYGLREYAVVHRTCADLFDLGRPVDAFHVDFLSDFAHYFVYSSVFSAFWVGITAGGLRLQSARAAAGDPLDNDLRQFQAFHWACFLGWAVRYRASPNGALLRSDEARPSG